MVAFRCWLAAALALIMLFACTPAPKTKFGKNWATYTAQFYRDGRIADTGNQGVSHSESQGYGMLFAVAADDKKRFAEIWRWTSNVLQRQDALFSWRYAPCPSADRHCIDDPNNASDGDILIAWALLRAADKWGQSDYRKQALNIVRSIKQKLVKQAFGYTLLLPGEHGFEKVNGILLNLSYWVFPAFHRFAQETNDPVWDQLIESGEELVRLARFGSFKLPPDWLRISQTGISLDKTINQEYGFNAVRIPLQLIWHKPAPHTRTLLHPFTSFWQRDFVPAVVNLETNAVAEYPMTKGMAYLSSTVIQLNNSTNISLTSLPPGEDYYSSSLILLSQLAAVDNNS